MSDDTRPEGAPDSPFFWRMSEAVIANDAASETPGFDAQAYMAEMGIEHDAVVYMGRQRVMLSSAVAKLGLFDPSVTLTATWVDGFATAMKMRSE